MADIINDKINCEITKEQAEFLEEYVMSMSGGSDTDLLEINYKKDFILTEEIQKMGTDLDDVFWTCLDEWSSVQLEIVRADLLENYPEEYKEYLDEGYDYPYLEDSYMIYRIEDVIITTKNEKFFVALYVNCEIRDWFF